jgi:microcystin degradation protein MlrC
MYFYLDRAINIIQWCFKCCFIIVNMNVPNVRSFKPAPLCVGEAIVVVIIWITTIFHDRSSFQCMCCSIFHFLGFIPLARRIVCVDGLLFFFCDLDNFFGPNLQPALIEQSSFIFDFHLSLFFQITLLYIVFQLIHFLCY